MHKHVAVWIDHKEAHLFRMHPDNVEDSTVKAAPMIHHKHPKGPEGAKEHPEDQKRFFHEVALSLRDSDEVLLVGPSSAKLEFLNYVRQHEHALEPRIIGIETVDHPTDGQFVAYARKYFTDRLDCSKARAS